MTNITWYIDDDGIEWCKDKRDNRNSVEYWGAKEKAEVALLSLRNCARCINCKRCDGCSRCINCINCTVCYGCNSCTDCTDCKRCTGCPVCYRCKDCERCTGCERCADCADCDDCNSCTDCYRCIDCTGYHGQKLDPSIPKIPNIHKAVYDVVSKPDALDMDSWHTCETTHCRAGWVVALAGKKGKALEKKFSTLLAAMMIYDKSDPSYKINPCRFYDSNEEALADMKRLAEKE